MDVGTNEGFLCHFLRLRRIPEEAQEVVVQPDLVPLDEDVEGSTLPAGDGLDEFLVAPVLGRIASLPGAHLAHRSS